MLLQMRFFLPKYIIYVWEDSQLGHTFGDVPIPLAKESEEGGTAEGSGAGSSAAATWLEMVGIGGIHQWIVSAPL